MILDSLELSLICICKYVSCDHNKETSFSLIFWQKTIINGLSDTPWLITTLQVHDKHTSEKALIHYLLFMINVSASDLCISNYGSMDAKSQT